LIGQQPVGAAPLPHREKEPPGPLSIGGGEGADPTPQAEDRRGDRLPGGRRGHAHLGDRPPLMDDPPGSRRSSKRRQRKSAAAAAWYLCIIPARYISGPRGRSSQPMARRESLSRLQSSTVSRRHLDMVSAISCSTSATAGQP